MAETIFRSITRDSNSRNAITKSLMEGVKIDENFEVKMKERVKYLNNLVEKEGTKLDKLLDMYFEKQVNMSEYERYQKKATKKIEKYKIEIEDLERKIESLEAPEVRLEIAKQSLKKLLDFDYNGINNKIIEEVVEKIIVHKDYFEWKLNFMSDTIKLQIIGRTVADSYVADYESKDNK